MGLESEGLQAIATRVSSGDECSVIIEDGYSVSSNETPVDEIINKSFAPKERDWKNTEW